MKETIALEEPGSTTIEQILPDNFEKLSRKKQKEIIASTVLNTYRELAETLQFKHKAEEAKKLLQKKIRETPDSKKLQQVQKQLKEASYTEIVLMSRYEGMKALAETLGFDTKLIAEKIG